MLPNRNESNRPCCEHYPGARKTGDRKKNKMDETRGLTMSRGLGGRFYDARPRRIERRKGHIWGGGWWAGEGCGQFAAKPQAAGNRKTIDGPGTGKKTGEVSLGELSCMEGGVGWVGWGVVLEGGGGGGGGGNRPKRRKEKKAMARKVCSIKSTLFNFRNGIPFWRKTLGGGEPP